MSIHYQRLTLKQQQQQQQQEEEALLGGSSNISNNSKESIRQLFQQTFTDSENEQEGKTVGQLSYDLMDQPPPEDLFVFVAASTTAESNNTTTTEELVGCIMLSRLTFPEEGGGSNKSTTISFLLSPVAVRTSFQKRGIGQGLLRFAFEQLKESTGPKIDLIMTYGDPNYYSKVGFQPVKTDTIPAPFPLSMPQGWLALPLHQTEIQSISFGTTSCCVAALNKKDLW